MSKKKRNSSTKKLLGNIATLFAIIILSPILILLLPSQIIFKIKRYLLNRKRRLKGKTPEVICIPPKGLKWSNEEAEDTTKKTIHEFEEILVEAKKRCLENDTKVFTDIIETLKKALVAINDDSITTEEIYDICRFIRESKLKWPEDYYHLHDWLLEKADTMSLKDIDNRE